MTRTGLPFQPERSTLWNSDFRVSFRAPAQLSSMQRKPPRSTRGAVRIGSDMALMRWNGLRFAIAAAVFTFVSTMQASGQTQQQIAACSGKDEPTVLAMIDG